MHRGARSADEFGVGFRSLPAIGPNMRHVFGADESAIDRKRSVGVYADEYAGDGDVGRIELCRSIVEGGQSRLDLAHTRIDFVRQFVGVLIFRFESGLLGGERLNGRLFLERQIDRRAGDLAETERTSVV